MQEPKSQKRSNCTATPIGHASASFEAVGQNDSQLHKATKGANKMHKFLRVIQSGALVATFYWAAGVAAAQTPDNTKANKGDADKTAITADRQKMNKSDT